MAKFVDDNDDVIRMNVHVYRDEHPVLFNELSKFSKGVKRVQRLKTIASERLLVGAIAVVDNTALQGLAGYQPQATTAGDSAKQSSLTDQGAMPMGDAAEFAALNELLAPAIKG